MKNKETMVRIALATGGIILGIILCASTADATEGQYQRNTGCHNSKKIGFHCHDKKGGIILKDKKQEAVRKGPSKECESMLKWLEGSRTNKFDQYIDRDIWGNPEILLKDAVKLARECRK